MKCKTCKHWDSQGFNLGQCSGIFPTSKIIPIPNQPKGKPDGKLITKPGIIVGGNTTNVTTTSDWYCKNWTKNERLVMRPQVVDLPQANSDVCGEEGMERALQRTFEENDELMRKLSDS